jgi:hypothetical protein
LDTRTKSLPLGELAAAFATGDWVVVAGLFDPLTPAQARWLAEFASDGRKLMAIVLESDDSLLTAKARAELVAGLRSVAVVAIANSEDWRKLIGQNARLQLIEDLEGERARTADFIQFVLNRHNA